MSPVISNPPFVDSESMEAFARDIRQQTGMTRIPVDPYAIASRLGIVVLEVTFEDEGVEGVLRHIENSPQILVRETSVLSRKKFTVAHELGHKLLHWDDDEDPREVYEEFVDSGLQLYRRGQITDPRSKADRDREIQANMFAAALLMPKNDLIAILPRIVSVRDLAKTFGVSEIAMHYRINELDVW